MKEPSPPTIVPYDQLSPDALKGVIEHHISKDGPDSGHIELSFQKKYDQVIHNLRTGKALILYDASSQTCNIFSKDDPLIRDYL